jgi:class 3 adenylate cyclase/tetratricopeptide (TPR) repeat protein
MDCGAAQQLSCPGCGTGVQPAQKFCMECGTALAAASSPTTPPPLSPGGVRAERRLVSVLFADLVGFTTLSERRDPEEVRELLSRYFDRCRTVIEQFGGTVEKFIGDAVMAVWGSPVAREDDAERAVRAAISLTNAVAVLGEEMGRPELRVRAGVLTGNAAVDVGAEREGMVLGDTVNAASRLQSIAAPGTVLVDDVTRRASEAAIEYEDTGTHEVKGREQPIHAWTALRVVAGMGGARRGSGLEAPFVGRERELQTIVDVADDSITRRTARLVTVTGDAGAGKSRLLWEFFKYMDGIEEVRWWHQGRCLSYGEGVSYWALAEMVRARAGIVDEDDMTTEDEKLQATIEQFVSDEREQSLVQPRLAQLLGLDQRSGREAADLFSGWRLFFERMADAAPVVLAFEDLQWADSGLLDFIDYLLEWSADHPIFILALARPELEERRESWGTAIRLGPLANQSMQRLLEGLVPGLPADLTAQILKRAEGVPLYGVETVRMLLDRGVLAQEGSRYVVAGDVEDLEVPETLQALAAARLDNLAASERALLQDAAVLGSSFTPAAVAAVSEQRETDVRDLLDSLVVKQVLGRDDDPRSSEPGQYHFLQGLLRTISLSTLSRRDRKARHLAAARHLEHAWGADAGDIAEVLASHYLGAVTAEPEAPDVPAIRRRARETLVAGARRASVLALGAEASTLFQRAAALSETEADRAVTLAEAGTAAARSDRELGSKLLEEAISVLEAADQREQAGLTQMRLADVLIGLNRLEQASELLAVAEPALRDPAHIAEAAARRGHVAFLLGDYELTRNQSELALSIADPRRLAPVIAEAAMNKAVALDYDGRQAEAGALMSLALDIAVAADLPEIALRSYYNLADYHCLMAHIDEAVTHIDRGLALARERGSRAWERDLIGQSVQIDLIRGEWERALAATQSLDVPGAEESRRVAMSFVPTIYAARGELAVLEAGLAVIPPPSDWKELRMIETMAQAVALQATGQSADAAARVGSIADDLARISTVAVAFFLEDAVDILVADGRRDTAARLTGGDIPGQPLLAPQRLLAKAMLHVDAGEDEPAEVAFRDSLAALRLIDAPFMRARCLHRLAGVLLSQGTEAEAAELLREAEELFSRLGATICAQRVRALMLEVAA